MPDTLTSLAHIVNYLGNPYVLARFPPDISQALQMVGSFDVWGCDPYTPRSYCQWWNRILQFG